MPVSTKKKKKKGVVSVKKTKSLTPIFPSRKSTKQKGNAKTKLDNNNTQRAQSDDEIVIGDTNASKKKSKSSRPNNTLFGC